MKTFEQTEQEYQKHYSEECRTEEDGLCFHNFEWACPACGAVVSGYGCDVEDRRAFQEVPGECYRCFEKRYPDLVRPVPPAGNGEELNIPF